MGQLTFSLTSHSIFLSDNILSMPESNTLPTLPFTALITLLNHTPLATDDGVVLRRMSLETGSIHLILACLAVLSHQSPVKGEMNPFPEVGCSLIYSIAGERVREEVLGEGG